MTHLIRENAGKRMKKKIWLLSIKNLGHTFVSFLSGQSLDSCLAGRLRTYTTYLFLNPTMVFSVFFSVQVITTIT